MPLILFTTNIRTLTLGAIRSTAQLFSLQRRPVEGNESVQQVWPSLHIQHTTFMCTAVRSSLVCVRGNAMCEV
jgi:hypothetical protein